MPRSRSPLVSHARPGWSALGNVRCVQLTWRNGLDGKEAAEVMRLLDEVERYDGVAAAGEQVILRLKEHGDMAQQAQPVQGDVRSEHFLVRTTEDELIGYAHLDVEHEPKTGELVAELAAHPERRGAGVGARLVDALLERAELPAEETGDTGRLRIWSHGQHPAALRLAERHGFARVRELLRMGRAVDEGELPEVPEPTGITVREFQVGADETEVVRVNHRAFAWHPEQGEMDERELRTKEQEDWFDPTGFLLAEDSAGTLLGFHWTKVHPDGTGEVYVLGVDPDTQGSGLGKALTLAGLRYLRDTGCPQVMLYVEGDNAAAVRVYERLGFARWDVDVQFGR